MYNIRLSLISALFLAWTVVSSVLSSWQDQRHCLSSACTICARFHQQHHNFPSDEWTRSNISIRTGGTDVRLNYPCTEQTDLRTTNPFDALTRAGGSCPILYLGQSEWYRKVYEVARWNIRKRFGGIWAEDGEGYYSIAQSCEVRYRGLYELLDENNII